MKPSPRLLLSLLVLLALATPASSEEGGLEAARKAAARVRAGLPAPTPAITLSYEGDLLIEDLWAGEITLTARIAKLGTQWVWRVTESSFLDWSGGEVREKVMLHVGQDLGILSGTYEHSDRDGAVTLGFSRSAEGFDVQRRRKQGEDWRKTESLSMKAPPAAMGTLAAALLLLRAVGPEAGRELALPWVANPAWKDPTSGANDGPLRLRTEGPGHFEHGGKRFETSRVSFRPGGTSWTLHLARDHRTLIGMVSETGPVRVVPRGLGGERVAVDPTQPATTWKQAFLKFGFGYHMARTELLEEAFHWEAMYEHETKTLERWPAEKPLAEFKQAWIAEFVAGSKHRDVVATRRLLSMTLATGKVVKETADEVVFRAHPNFGGGTQRTYYLRRVQGVWAITHILF